MKQLNIIFISACLFFSAKIHAQELQWLNIFEKENGFSKILTIDQMSDGNYLLFAYQEKDFYEGQGFTIIYDNAGKVLKEDSLNLYRNSGLLLQQLNDDTYLLTFRNGEVYNMNDLTDSPKLMFTSEYEGQQVALKYGKTWNNILTLVGRQADTDTSTIHFKIDLEEKKLTNTYVSDSTLISISLDYLENGDRVECFRPNIVRKTSEAGTLIWEKIIPLSDFALRSVAVDSEENVYLAGYQRESNIRSAILIALNKNGEQLWERKLEPEGAEDVPFIWFYTLINKIKITSDGSIIGVGTDGASEEGPYSDVFACKYNLNGDMVWSMKYDISGGGSQAYGILLDEEDIVITGVTGESDFAGSERGFTFKIKDLSFVKDTLVKELATYVNHSIVSEKAVNFYPNPGKTHIHIDHKLLNYENFTVQLLNEQGQIVSENSNNKLIPISHLTAGKYIVRVKANHFTFSTIWIKVE